MVLVIDVGNTNMKAVLFRDGEIEQGFKIPTASDPASLWAEVDRRWGTDLLAEGTRIAVSTVVKGVDEGLRDALEAYCSERGRSQGPVLSVMGRETVWPLASAYSPGLGSDRMLAAVGAAERYGPPIVVVDIGSAVTLDAVSEDGVFLGGIILPGARMRLRVLKEGSSLLPEVRIPDEPPPLIGTNTVECISSGVHHGMREEISGLVTRIQQEVGATRAVLTGEGSRLFAHRLPEGWVIDEWLVPRGIYSVVAGGRDVKS